MIEKKEIELGELSVKTSQIRVTDPSYCPETTPSWCSMIINKVKKGTWKCVATMVDMPAWGKRVSELWIHHKDLDELEGEDMIGSVTVDSGQCGFFFNKAFKELYKDSEKSDKWYNFICENNHDAGLILENGVVTSSGIGDGMYDVYIAEDENDMVESIRLLFIDLDAEDWKWAED